MHNIKKIIILWVNLKEKLALSHQYPVYLFPTKPSGCFDPNYTKLMYLIIQNYAALVSIRRMFCLVQLYRSALAVGAYALLISPYYSVLLG